jgi:hypothetical protein
MGMNGTTGEVPIDLGRLRSALRRAARRRASRPVTAWPSYRTFNGLEARLRLQAAARLAPAGRAIPPMLSLPVFLRAPARWVARRVRRAADCLLGRQAACNHAFVEAAFFLARELEAAEAALRVQEPEVRRLRARLAALAAGRRAEDP